MRDRIDLVSVKVVLGFQGLFAEIKGDSVDLTTFEFCQIFIPIDTLDQLFPIFFSMFHERTDGAQEWQILLRIVIDFDTG